GTKQPSPNIWVLCVSPRIFANKSAPSVRVSHSHKPIIKANEARHCEERSSSLRGTKQPSPNIWVLCVSPRIFSNKYAPSVRVSHSHQTTSLNAPTKLQARH